MPHLGIAEVVQPETDEQLFARFRDGRCGRLPSSPSKTRSSSGSPCPPTQPVMTGASALQGTWNVKVNGGSPTAQLRACIPKLLGDAGSDLDWPKR